MCMKSALREQIKEKSAGIRLLALDVDGTLFTEDGQITPASIEAIKKARQGAKIQKGTLNFVRLPDGTLQNREEIRVFLEQMGGLNIVNGGYDNLEFNKAGVDKSLGIRYICELLDIPADAVAAIGDSENDIEMLRQAGLGIAMGNALDDVKAKADAVTLSNEEDGVAAAIAAILE